MRNAKIYTKTGDLGETGLVSGNRISKSDHRIDLYGELDELNSRVGYSTALLEGSTLFQKNVEFLQDLQSAIFDLGSNLACEYENRKKYNLPQLTEALVARIENEIDQMEKELPALKNFILPGGTPEVASIHLCRTSTRSVERKLVYYHNNSNEELPDCSLPFLNRLSDYFFVLARYVGKIQGKSEIMWKPRS